MKNIIKSVLTVLVSLSFLIVHAQDEATGLPGDHFSLQGALEMFKNSSSPEDFEKRINTQDNHVNNLDLNEDGDIDYIRVIDKPNEDGHAFILQVAISASENQDIAVIELEKDGSESAIIQIIGDEDIYGEALIVEPTEEGASSPKKGPSMYEDDIVVVNVWGWPTVRFIYGPVYRPWISPWRWALYPTWWRPWRPLTWAVFHPFRASFYRGFGFAPLHRTVRIHKVYAPARVTSVTVVNRHRTNINNYRVNRTKTTVVATKGNKTVKAQKTTTSVSGRRGKAEKTTRSATVRNNQTGNTARASKTTTKVRGRRN